MNKQLFFLLTSCAVVAVSGIANAIETDVDAALNKGTQIINQGGMTLEQIQNEINQSYSDGTGVKTLEEWSNAIGNQYKGMTLEQLQQLANKNYIIDEAGNLLEAGQDAVSQEFQEQVSQLGNAISDSSSDIIGKAQEAIGLGNVSELRNTISSLNTSLDQMGALSSQVDTMLGGVQSDALNAITGGAGLTDAMNLSSQVGAQLTGAMELMNNPQSMLTMGLGYIGWDQITNLSMGAAMDAVTDFMSAPTVGIPVMEGGFIASNAADKAAKAETAAVNNKVSDEKQKQLDAVGSRPSTPAGPEVAEAPDADTNPSIDSCPALMASYPRQSNKAYDFLKMNYLDAKPEKVHAAAKKTMDAAVPYVESLFFVKDEKDLTAEEQEKIHKKRDEYLADMVADVLTLNIGVQQNLVEDAMSIPTAPTSGCNLIDDLNVSTMIMISTAKQAMADIALQIQLLEFEGIQRIVNTDIKLLDKPEEKDNK